MAVQQFSPEEEVPAIVTGRAANAPANVSAALYVVIPSWGPDKWGPVGWVAPKSGMPAVGSTCLCAFDEGDNPWVIAWA